MTRTAILVSGTDRSLKNLLDLEQAGELPIQTALVISSKPDVKALEYAQAREVPTVVCDARALTETLDTAQIDLVVMAG